jgi:hypothetical protein
MAASAWDRPRTSTQTRITSPRGCAAWRTRGVPLGNAGSTTLLISGIRRSLEANKANPYDRLQGHQAACASATPLRHGVVKTGRVWYILGEYRDPSIPLKSASHLYYYPLIYSALPALTVAGFGS